MCHSSTMLCADAGPQYQPLVWGCWVPVRSHDVCIDIGAMPPDDETDATGSLGAAAGAYSSTMSFQAAASEADIAPAIALLCSASSCCFQAGAVASVNVAECITLPPPTVGSAALTGPMVMASSATASTEPNNPARLRSPVRSHDHA